MTLKLMPDVVAMAVTLLRAEVEVTDLCGAVNSIRGQLIADTVYPAVRVSRIANEPVISEPFWLEMARLQFDCYGGNNVQAERLGQAVRAAMARNGVNFETAQGVITKVRVGNFFSDPDEEFTPTRERYIAEVDVWVHPAKS